MADDEDYGEDDDDFEDYEDEFEADEAEQAEPDIQQVLQQEAAAVAERLKQANKGPVKTQFLASQPAIEQPLAAAIGSGLPINEPVGNLIVDVGGGTSETALISMGGVVALEAVRVGSFDLDVAIQNFIKKEFGVAIGERTAEEIKLTIGSASAYEGELRAEVRGRHIASGLPEVVVVSPSEIREAIEEPVSTMVDSVTSCLSKAPPEMAQDIIVQGISLVGGGSLLKGFDKRLSEETDVPVHIVPNALEAVVLGAGRCIESFESVRAMFMEDPNARQRR